MSGLSPVGFGGSGGQVAAPRGVVSEIVAAAGIGSPNLFASAAPASTSTGAPLESSAQLPATSRISARSIFKLVELSSPQQNGLASPHFTDGLLYEVRELSGAQIKALGKTELGAISIIDLSAEQLADLDSASYRDLMPATQ